MEEETPYAHTDVDAVDKDMEDDDSGALQDHLQATKQLTELCQEDLAALKAELEEKVRAEEKTCKKEAEQNIVEIEQDHTDLIEKLTTLKDK